MSDQLAANLLLLAALCACVAGMVWLALSMEVHALQVWEHRPSSVSLRLLRMAGSISIAFALLLCLMVDHATMAVLVWVMGLSGAALLVAFTLSSRPRRLRLFTPWLSRRS
ncbi:DUF3325 domain-containing protein [Stenotrophomonas sp.]|uniref:DUF3325 domain-containing protein n=1 Tax=Stenotrophomonas sp. TaxID=69392 RepID=UPI0028AAFD8A|nr:DUF3325 domain-containing protein [Stenotrophomonas sp.]